eukprot:4691523-Alexandrium_andersonii.AAC.1
MVDHVVQKFLTDSDVVFRRSVVRPTRGVGCDGCDVLSGRGVRLMHWGKDPRRLEVPPHPQGGS